MGLLDNTIQRDYYQGNDLGNYQFTSLENIINQFQMAYVGEDKLISKIKRVDVAFHAMRALQELSFDTFKSVKSQQIDLPPTLVMPLPHDYVNYTKLSWVDSAGIKHPLYRTNDTSNPFQINQHDDGSYNFENTTSDTGILENSDFSSSTNGWNIESIQPNVLDSFGQGGMGVEDGVLKTSFHTRGGGGATNWGYLHLAYQAVDVTGVEYLDISASGTADTFVASASPNTNTAANVGVLRFGLTSQIPDTTIKANRTNNATVAVVSTSPNVEESIFDLNNYAGNPSYLEWVGPDTVGSTTSDEELLSIDVGQYNTVYAVVVSYVNFNVPVSASQTKQTNQVAFKANSIDDIVVSKTEASSNLKPKPGNEKNSSTWNNYKAVTPSENNNDDYEDDIYWPIAGNRYGLDPQRAQVNGSFYIDQRLGRIHFSSNISGKPVILDYISDSLGTDAEMQVHKFAEEAMYKYIMYAILSTRANTNENVVRRYKKERFAAIRTAKLRLSNIKLEEITQILRGKSKQIKH